MIISPLLTLRDETYTRLLLKKGLNQFSFNTFGTKKTWKPGSSPEEMQKLYPNGLVTVVGGVLGDRVALSRDNLVMGEFSVKIGFQKYIVTDVASSITDPVDALVNFTEELELMCRQELQIDEMTYVRTEYEKDDSGLPFHFVRISEDSTFEAYFDAFFHTPIPDTWPVTVP